MSNLAYSDGPSFGDDTPAETEQVPVEARARPVPRISIQCFCEDPNTADALQQAADDRRLAKAHVTVQMGGVPAAVAAYDEAPTPNLVILETFNTGDQVLVELNQLASVTDAGTSVIVIGHVNDVLLYRELQRQGVADYLIAPLTPLELMEAISGLYTAPEAEPIGHVVTFIGAKGGVGSSTICHNTAWAITATSEAEVVIADFDLPFGTAGLDFNQDPVQGIAEALGSPERLDDVLLDRLLSKCSDRLSLFAAPGTLDRTYDLDTDNCDAVLSLVRQNVPVVTVDLPNLWTGWSKAMLHAADDIVITATPDLANLRNAKNLVDLLKEARPHDRAPHLVLNQVGVSKRPEIEVRDFASALDVDPRLVIDFDPQLFGTAANNGQMIEEVSEKSRAAAQFRELAYLLTNRTEPKSERSSFLAPLLSKLNLKRTG